MRRVLLTTLIVSLLPLVDVHAQEGLMEWDRISTTKILGVDEPVQPWMPSVPPVPDWVQLLKEVGVTFDGGPSDPLLYRLPGGGYPEGVRESSPWKGDSRPWLGPPPWVPGPGPGPNVPEPATVLILGFGAILVILTQPKYNRRKRWTIPETRLLTSPGGSTDV